MTPPFNRCKVRCGFIDPITSLAFFAMLLGTAFMWAFSAEPGTGKPGTKRFKEWQAENYAQDPRDAVGVKVLSESLSLYKSLERKLFIAYPFDEAPPDWPRGTVYPFDFDALMLVGAPEVVRSRTTSFLADLDDAGLANTLDQVSDAEPFAFPLQEHWGNPATMISLGHIRQISRYNTGRFAVALDSKDEKEMVRVFNSTARLAHAVAGQPTLIARLVAVSLMARSTNELRTALVGHDFSPESLATCQRLLDQHASWPPIEIYLANLRADSEDLIHNCYSDDKSGDGRLVLNSVPIQSLIPDAIEIPVWMSGVSDSRIVNILGFKYPTKKESLIRLEIMLATLAQFSGTPASARREAHHSPEFTPIDAQHYPILAITSSATIKFIENDAEMQTIVAGTRLMLAIERFRATRKVLPKSLEEFAPDFIAAVPLDPWTGTPFVYKRLSSPDEHGRDYLLYSLGSNLRDDGGVYEDFQAFSESETARNTTSDFIFNTPRPVYDPRK